MMNLKGKELLQLKQEYMNMSGVVQKMFNEILENKVSSGEISKDIIDKIQDKLLNVKSFEEYLIKTDGFYYSNDEIIKSYCDTIVNNLAKNGCKYLSSGVSDNNIVIIKKLGITEDFAKANFVYPELESIVPTKKKGAKSKIEIATIESIKTKNQKKIENWDKFINDFATMRLPKVGKHILVAVNKAHPANIVRYEISDVYYSEILNIYNIDFKIIIPSEHYLKETKNRSSWRSKEAFVTEIKSIINIVETTYHKKLGI